MRKNNDTIEEISILNPNHFLSEDTMRAAVHRFIDNHHETWKELYGLENYTSWIGGKITNRTLPSGYSMVLIYAQPSGTNILLICEDTKDWSEEELFNKFDSWPHAKVLDIKPSI